MYGALSYIELLVYRPFYATQTDTRQNFHACQNCTFTLMLWSVLLGGTSATAPNQSIPLAFRVEEEE